MAHSVSKDVARLLAQADGDIWNDYRNLARLLSFALKLRDLAFPARRRDYSGAKNCRKIIRLLVVLVVEPSEAERRAREAEMPSFQRMSALASQDKQAPLYQARRVMLMRRVLRLSDGAHNDAKQLNNYVRRLLELYDIADQVEDETFHLSLADQPGGELTRDKMKDWHNWSRYHFFRQGSVSLGDILQVALRERSIDQRVAAELALLD